MYCPTCLRSMTILQFPRICVRSLKIIDLPAYIPNTWEYLAAVDFNINRKDPSAKMIKSGQSVTILVGLRIFQRNFNGRVSYRQSTNKVDQLKENYYTSLLSLAKLTVGTIYSNDEFLQVLGCNTVAEGSNDICCIRNSDNVAVANIELHGLYNR